MTGPREDDDRDYWTWNADEEDTLGPRPQYRQEEGLMSGECPAGGEHRWVTELPEDYYLLTGARRSTAFERTHCEECGISPPKDDDR